MGPKKKVESEVELVKEVPVYRTPSYYRLFDAIGDGDIDRVEHVLQQKEKPLELLRKKDLQGLTPLRKAISLNKSDICRLLITYGAEPSVRDPLGKTVLHRATSVGSRDLIASLLVSPDSNVNIQDSFGWTPLHYAVRGKHQHAIDWLLFLGADVSLKNKEDHTAVEMCPPDFVMLPYLRRLENRNVKEEPCHIACSFVGAYSMSQLGSDNRVKMVTSHDWPNKTQFMLGARKRPAYCLPPVPLRQDEDYFSESIHYRLMHELPEGKTRVKVYTTVFEELSHTELVMKITSKTKFLGEVPVKMSNFLKNNYNNYLAGGDLDLKNHGQFVMVKRPIKYLLIRDDDGLLYSPEHDGFLLNLPEWALIECPEDFDENREKDALEEKEAMMVPLLKKFALLMQDPKYDVYEEKKKAKDHDGDDEMDANQSAQSVVDKTEDKKKMKDLKKSYAPSTIDTTEEDDEVEDIPVLLDGTEPDNCEDFYYISRGWGLYLVLRPNINSKLLLEIMEPGLGEESLLRCATMFYTMKHSSGTDTEDPFTVQIPKSEAYQWAPFVKVGTVLVYVRRALSPGEEENPDPDDTVDETYLAEDGKSSKLEWWLQKERERWSLLPTGISNRQTRVIFDTNILSTYIAVQMNYGTEKWKSEATDGTESDEEGGGSDDENEGEEGTEGGETEDGEGGEGEDGGKKKKKKKKKGGEGDDEGSKDDNESNNLLDDKSNNKQGDTSNNKFVTPQTEKKVSFGEPESEVTKATQDKRGGFKPSDEPEAPAPSPQASDTTFKDKSNAECSSDNDSTDSDSNESTTDNDNNNSLGARGTDRNRNTNAAKESKSKSKGGDTKSIETSKVALGNDKEMHEVEMKDPYIGLRMVERTNAVGMPTTSSSFFSLEPRPPPPEEIDPSETESEEFLPSRKSSRRMSLMVRKEGQLHLEEFEYGAPLYKLEFPEDIDMETVAKEVAIMYRYRNHLLLTLCCFMRNKPNSDNAWDFVIELITVIDLEVRAEMWMGMGYSLKARSANFPLKSNRQLNLIMQGGGVLFDDEEGVTPAGVVKLIEVFYSSSRTNCFQMIASKPKEKGFKKAGGKKKDEKEVKAPDITVLIELFFPMGNPNQKKEVGLLNIFLDTPNLWLDNHVALRERDNPLLNRLVVAMTESEDVCLLWWKVWIFLGYTESEVEKEKGNMDWPAATKKILQRWFTDNLDNSSRGISKLVAVLHELKQEETVESLIDILKSCKVNEIMTEVKKPRYHAMLFHWLMETKISLNSLLKTIDLVVMAPNSDQFLLRVADVLVIEDIHELGGAMEVEDNVIYTIKDEENILDPAYKTYRVLVKARAKNEDIVKYMVLLLEMVKRLGQPKRAGDFVVNETRKWMETVPDMKELCNKLDNLLSTYVPNVDKKPSEANAKLKGGSHRASMDGSVMEEDE